jgi:hypothetical protein
VWAHAEDRQGHNKQLPQPLQFARTEHPATREWGDCGFEVKPEGKAEVYLGTAFVTEFNDYDARLSPSPKPREHKATLTHHFRPP